MFPIERTAGPERTSFGLGAAARGLRAGLGKSGEEEAGEAGGGPESRALGAAVRASSTERGETVEAEYGGQWGSVSPQCRDNVTQVGNQAQGRSGGLIWHWAIA